MTKQELINVVAEKTQISKKDVASIINAALDKIGDALSRGDKVTLIGFGTFKVRERAAHDANNPREPGQVVHVPAKKIPVFKASQALKDRVK